MVVLELAKDNRLRYVSLPPRFVPLQRTAPPGALLSKRLRLAISERDVQQASFEIFSEQQGARVNVWKQMVMDFEEDGARQNPYEVPCTGKGGVEM